MRPDVLSSEYENSKGSNVSDIYFLSGMHDNSEGSNLSEKIRSKSILWQEENKRRLLLTRGEVMFGNTCLVDRDVDPHSGATLGIPLVNQCNMCLLSNRRGVPPCHHRSPGPGLVGRGQHNFPRPTQN